MGAPKHGGIRYSAISGGRKVLTEQIILAAVLGVTGCLLIALESTLLSRIPLPIFGWQTAYPALGLLFSMAVGFLHGEREGGVTGLLSGILTDAAGSETVMVLPLLYFLCGYLSGTVGKRRLAHNLPSFLVFALVGGGLFALTSIGRAAIASRSFPAPIWIWRGVVPVWLATLAFSPAVYGIVWGEKKLMEPKN